MFSSLSLIVAISSSMILANPVPAAQFEGTISNRFSFSESSTITAPSFNIPLSNDFLTSSQLKNLFATADYTTPQADNLLLTDDATTLPDSLLLAHTEDTKVVEICRSQGGCGLLGSPIPTSPDLSPPPTPEMQWLDDKTSQPMTTEFVNFKCGGTQSVCCENWHQIPTQQRGSKMPSNNNLWLSCSDSNSAHSPPSSAATSSFSNSFLQFPLHRAVSHIRWFPWDCP